MGPAKLKRSETAGAEVFYKQKLAKQQEALKAAQKVGSSPERLNRLKGVRSI